MTLVDGHFIEGTTAPFDVTDRGLTLADGLFETMPAYGGRVWRLGDHLDRMAAGFAVLGFDVPRERLEADVLAVAGRAPPSGAVLRLTVTRGAGARGLVPPVGPKPTVIATSAPLAPSMIGEPTTLATVPIRRNDTSPTSRLKSLAYLDNVLALKAALAAGAKDALMLNTRGRIACTSVANVFRVTADGMETPPVEEGVLPGIARARVLALAAGAGLTVREVPIDPAALSDGSAIFLTNSVRLVQPVTAIDGRPLPRSEVAERVLALLRADVARDCGTAL